MQVKPRSDLDPVGRSFYEVDYEGSPYWVRPTANRNHWVVVKDLSHSNLYVTYHVRLHKDLSGNCTCAGSAKGSRCRHVVMVTEILKSL